MTILAKLFARMKGTVAKSMITDRERLKSLLKVHWVDSPPVASFIEKIRGKYTEDVYFYNNLLTALVHSRVRPNHIENILQEMRRNNINGDSYTRHILLYHFCINKSAEKAEVLAASITDLNTTGLTSLVSMYGKLGDTRKAREWFDKSQSRDTVLFNAILQVYVDHEEWNRVHEVFQMMTSCKTPPDHITFKLFFKALLLQGNVKEALRIYTDHIQANNHVLFEGNYKEMLKWLQTYQEKFLNDKEKSSEEWSDFASLHKILSQDALSAFPVIQ